MVQEVEINREHEDGKKWWAITWSTKSEGGDTGPVWNSHSFSQETRSQTPCSHSQLPSANSLEMGVRAVEEELPAMTFK